MEQKQFDYGVELCDPESFAVQQKDSFLKHLKLMSP